MSEKEVLFVSQLPYGQCENLTTIYDAYDKPKVFRVGQTSFENAELEGFAAVVCDSLPLSMIKYKCHCKLIILDHGIDGGKLYGMDEKFKPWINPGALAQIDYAIASSTATMDIVASQLNIPVSKVRPLGFPRTDGFLNDNLDRSGFCTRMYSYAPSFRYDRDGYLPKIRWKVIDDLLDVDEKLIVKRHYFTKEPILDGRIYKHVRETDPRGSGTALAMFSDVLITDYSSIMFDAYLMGRPVVLFTDDSDIFLKERGMYLPYPDVYSSRHIHAEGNEEAIVEMLREAHRNGMTDTERKLMDIVADRCDGHSTERIVRFIKRFA